MIPPENPLRERDTNPWAPWHDDDGDSCARDEAVLAPREYWLPRLLVIVLIVGALAGVEAVSHPSRGVNVPARQLGS